MQVCCDHTDLPDTRPRTECSTHLVPQKCGAADVQLQEGAAAPAAAGQLLDPEVQHPPREVLHLRHVHLCATTFCGI